MDDREDLSVEGGSGEDDGGGGPSLPVNPYFDPRDISYDVGTFAKELRRRRVRESPDRKRRRTLDKSSNDETTSPDEESSDESSLSSRSATRRGVAPVTQGKGNYGEKEEEEEAPPPPPPHPTTTPTNKSNHHDSSYSSSSSSDESNDPPPQQPQPHISPKRRPPPFCLSTHDVVIHERLPALYVCALAPDGETRHCFALETLYKAAIFGTRTTNGGGSHSLYHNHHNNNDSDNPNHNHNRQPKPKKTEFLQPPHFRTIMEDNLLDQFASRFGRSALVIENTSLYKKHQTLLRRTRREFFRDATQEEYDNADLGSFAEALNKFVTSQMGTGDMYCCPICYEEAKRRFQGKGVEDDESDDGSDEDEDEDEGESSEGDGGGGGGRIGRRLNGTVAANREDHMAILILDDDEFIVASIFCFRKVVQVKAHLRIDHAIDTRTVEGNDLYKNYMVIYYYSRGHE